MNMSKPTTTAEVDAVLLSNPTLNYAGMAWAPNTDLNDERNSLRSALDEIDRARTMLRHRDNRAFYAGREVSSYHLKHVAETRDGRHLGYVSQGALIVAAALEDFDVLVQGPHVCRVLV